MPLAHDADTALAGHRLDARSARVRYPLALAGAGLAAATTGRFGPINRASAATTFSLALDWYPNSNHAGIYVAQTQGAFERAGLAPKIYVPADPTTVLQTVGAGRDDFGISYQTDVLLARAQGVPVVSVAAVIQQPLLVLMASRAENITRPRDLKGKSIGAAGTPSDDAILGTILAADGVSLDEVNVVNVGYDLVPALTSGKVDAVTGVFWNHEVLIAQRNGFAANVIRVEDWGVPNYYELVLVASEDTVANRTDLVRALVDTLGLGYEAAAKDPLSALPALEAASPDLDAGLEAEALPISAPTWVNAAGQFGVQTSRRWDDYAAWMTKNGLLPGDQDVAKAWFQGVNNVRPLPATPAGATPAGATPAGTATPVR